jgi:nicotinate-nucleotide pyrophosphorylase (carboxylating)
MGLGDAALIKDNHVAATGSITAAIDDVRRHYPDVALEVECDTLEQVQEALTTSCSLILLDNMSVRQIGEAVELARPFPHVRLEASGGLTLSSAADVAATGVDYVAVGALTHSVRALDLGLDLL